METDKLGEMQFSDRGGIFLVSFFYWVKWFPVSRRFREKEGAERIFK